MKQRLVLRGVAPSVNHMYQNAKVGNRTIKVLKPAAQAWFDETTLQANNWRIKNKWSTASGKSL